MWHPITITELSNLILDAESQMTPALLHLWREISIQPKKWDCSPWGDGGGGFWVVAKATTTCVYYNDIEDGFNISKFHTIGKIDEYYCNQDELLWVIYRLNSPGS